jgi:hypothetical protein
LEIFELSGISNVGNCYQQIKFSKYQKKRIIEDIRPTVDANTENTILHTKQRFRTDIGNLVGAQKPGKITICS